MKLLTKNGRSLELWIHEYQFLEKEGKDYEDKRLPMAMALRGFKKPWMSISPCLTIRELRLLIEWLETTLSKSKSPSEINLAKQKLIFKLIQNPTGIFIIRLLLGGECKPEWHNNEPFSFDIEFDETQAIYAIADLEHQLKKFPTSGESMISS